jgi:predicted O-methyltransferase YrrM
MIDYIPKVSGSPKLIEVSSAWQTIPPVLADIILRFNLKRDIALEFGVERGYSTSALANYFKKVIGVDTFDWNFGDSIARDFDSVKELLRNHPQIQLIKSTFQEFIAADKGRYDLIHVDIGYETHEYDTTYPCGEWALQHSDCVLFHDTISFPGVNQACTELSEKYGFDFYNYSEPMGPAGQVCGLGILIKR